MPGQRLDVPAEDLEGPRVAAAYVFANYQAPGAHRARVEQFNGTLAVQLDSAAFTVLVTK
ncbi:hypothetical protein D3C72_2499280 [compost metagenome]